MTKKKKKQDPARETRLALRIDGRMADRLEAARVRHGGGYVTLSDVIRGFLEASLDNDELTASVGGYAEIEAAR